MPDRRLIAGFRGVAEALLPEEDLATQRAVRSAINPDGTIPPQAVGVLLTVALDIIGVAAIGADAALRRRLPQGARIDRIDADARTPPAGGEFTATLTANGATVGAVSLPAGQSTNGSNVTGDEAVVPAGAWLGLTVNAANGAADVAVIVTYRVGT